jgi:hypothetical protein
MSEQFTITLTIGHNVGNTPTYTTEEVAAAATLYLGTKGATVIEAKGLWCGMPEASTRIEVVRDNLTYEDIRKRVQRLSRVLRQEAIMTEVVRTSVEFLG